MKRDNASHQAARGLHGNVGVAAPAYVPATKGGRRVRDWLRRNFGTFALAVGMASGFAMAGVFAADAPEWARYGVMALSFGFLGMGVGWHVRRDCHPTFIPMVDRAKFYPNVKWR